MKKNCKSKQPEPGDRAVVILDLTVAAVLAVIGTVSTVGAVVYGAWWQLYVAGACAALAWTNIHEAVGLIKRLRRGDTGIPSKGLSENGLENNHQQKRIET
jgi:hypothetical protein